MIVPCAGLVILGRLFFKLFEPVAGIESARSAIESIVLTSLPATNHSRRAGSRGAPVGEFKATWAAFKPAGGVGAMLF